MVLLYVHQVSFCWSGLCKASCVAFCALYVLSRCVIFWQYTCQDVIFRQGALEVQWKPQQRCKLLCWAMFKCITCRICIFIGMCVLVQVHNHTCRIDHFQFLTRIPLQSILCVLCPLCMYCQDVSSFGNTPVKMCHLPAIHLSRCVIFRQYTCQDVSSFGNTPVKMCHLSAGGLEVQ